jgi:hypothetical protein
VATGVDRGDVVPGAVVLLSENASGDGIDRSKKSDDVALCVIAAEAIGDEARTVQALDGGLVVATSKRSKSLYQREADATAPGRHLAEKAPVNQNRRIRSQLGGGQFCKRTQFGTRKPP